MSYQVIARKYRPQRFSDVIGQEHVTQTLANAIAAGRIAHAYLFVGPRGTGKTTVARIFAKCLNCTGGPKVDFDENDPKCAEITEGRSLDVLEIDGASNRGIDEIRELRDTVKYAPASSRYKIYIIDEVHMLTKEAFNALLKTLEEPPAHAKFMFATTEPEKVLPTILSRCQRFDLRKIPTREIVQHLAHISKLEGVNADEAALYAIARGADGGMRDAESALDQLISFCGNTLQEADVLSMFGLTSRSQVLSLAEAVVAGDTHRALKELDSLANQGKDFSRLLADLQGHFRNALIYQISNGDLSLIEASETELDSLKNTASSLPVSIFSRLIETLAESEWRLREASSKRIALEVTLLKAIEVRQAVGVDDILQTLKQLRNQAGGGSAPTAASPAPAQQTQAAPAVAQRIQITPIAATPTPAPVAAPVTIKEEAAPAPTAPVQSGAIDLLDIWNRLLESIGRASPFTRSYLLEGHPVSFDGKVFVIGFDPEFQDKIALVETGRNRTVIQTKLNELGFENAGIRFVKAERPVGMARVAPQVIEQETAPKPAAKTEAPAGAKPVKAKVEPVKLNKEEFMNDPLIRKALEVFKGQIVEVRA